MLGKSKSLEGLKRINLIAPPKVRQDCEGGLKRNAPTTKLAKTLRGRFQVYLFSGSRRADRFLQNPEHLLTEPGHSWSGTTCFTGLCNSDMELPFELGTLQNGIDGRPIRHGGVFTFVWKSVARAWHEIPEGN